MISAQTPDEPVAHAWPVWEVQGYGTVTGPGEGEGGAARREIRPPWLDVRLTFADGARLDVLAVVNDGRIAIEEAQADPPLALDGFVALAGVIRAPLQDACQAFTGPSGQFAEGQEGETAGVAEAAEPVEAAADEVAGAGGVAGVTCVVGASACDTEDPAATGGAEAVAGTEAESGRPPEDTAGAPGADRPAVEPSGRHRARAATPRGAAGRRGVAEVYRAAQREGRDPVLAVMAATGLSRRKSLKLIAGARDEGYLTPRHHRR